MSFIKELDNICKYSRKEIELLAIKSFEDILKEHLVCQISEGLTHGNLYISQEKKKEWYVNFKYVLDSCKPYSQSYGINSDIVFDFLIKYIQSNSVFNGVELVSDFKCGIIHFSWNILSKEMSITKELQELFEERKTFIINEAKNKFNNLLREEMTIVAKKGVQQGYFYFENIDYYLLKNILDTTKKTVNRYYDICIWLLNITLKEQEDLTGIKVHVEEIPIKVYFSW